MQQKRIYRKIEFVLDWDILDYCLTTSSSIVFLPSVQVCVCVLRDQLREQHPADLHQAPGVAGVQAGHDGDDRNVQAGDDGGDGNGLRTQMNHVTIVVFKRRGGSKILTK
jgi:hypothetical protein